MISPAQFKTIFPQADAEAWAPAVSKAWANYGFTNKMSRAGSLAICGAETGGFVEVKRENMRYTPARAFGVFRKARQYPAEAANRIYRGPAAFANWVYAFVNGNGDEASGDGWFFRGTGILQHTGRGNMREEGLVLGVNLEEDPELLIKDPEISAAGAMSYMARRGVLERIAQNGEGAFLDGALLVGLPADDAATERRLGFRRVALQVLDETPGVRPPPRTLRYGDHGDDVKHLQNVLNGFGAMLDEDGHFGALTYLAVQHFQRQRGLAPDGVVGPRTRAALGLPL